MRWGNVGRAAVVLALLGVAVVWPRLEGGVPRVPSDVAVPLAVPAPPAGTARVRKGSGEGRRGADIARVRKGTGSGAEGAPAGSAGQEGNGSDEDEAGWAGAAGAEGRAVGSACAGSYACQGRPAGVTTSSSAAVDAPSTPAPRFHPDPATTEFSFETG